MPSRIKELVEGLLSRPRIEERFHRYPEIAKHFRREIRRHVKPPYYCHAMAWRLGTWHSEHVFERVEQLLRGASALSGWSGEKGLCSDGDYGAFWSLLWQLQVAEWVTDHGLPAAWRPFRCSWHFLSMCSSPNTRRAACAL
jgi:hypothetical protein